MHQPNKVLVEKERHRKAFEDYYALGDRRKYRLLADKLGISVSSVKLWCLTFGWKQRIAKRDAEVAILAREKSTADAVTGKRQNLKMLNALKIKGIKDFLEGKSKLSGKDLTNIIKLEIELQDQPDPAKPGGKNSLPSNIHIYIPDNGRGPEPDPSETEEEDTEG